MCLDSVTYEIGLPYYDVNGYACEISFEQASSINRSAFGRSFKEWKYCQFELQMLQGKDWMECPPCFESQHSVHADGNSKLKRLINSGS